MNPPLTISVCTYQSNDFEVMLINEETKQEVCLSGNQKLSSEEFELIQQLAPACVWTTYYPKEQYEALRAANAELKARCDKLEAAARDALKLIERFHYQLAGECGVSLSQAHTDLENVQAHTVLRSALSPKVNEDE